MSDPHSVAKTSFSKHHHKHRQMCEAEIVELCSPGRSSGFAVVAAVEEEEEEQKLADLCSSSFYHKHTRLIEVLMALSSVQLVATSTDSPRPVGGVDQKPGRKSPALHNVLRPVAAWPKFRPKDHKESAKSRTSWLSRLVWPPKMGLLAVLYLHYTFVKLLLLSTLSLKRHFILKRLKPIVQPQAPRTNSCALSEDLHFSTSDDWAAFEQLKSLDAWLKSLGMSMVSLPELSVTTGFLLSILPFFYHHTSQVFLALKRQRVDTLCFMLDPLGERRRIGVELRNIVRELIISQSNHKNNLYYGLENSEMLQEEGKLVMSSLRSVDSRSQRQDPATAHSLEVIAADRQRLRNDQVRRLRYLQALIKIRRLKQVNPYTVTSGWHRILLHRTNFLRLNIWTIITGAAILMLLAILYDLYDTTRLRLEMVECTKWHTQGTRIVALDHLYLDELELVEHLDAYKGYDGSATSFIKLALLVESTSYFSLRRVICWLEGLLVDYLLVLLTTLTLALHLTSTSEKIAWLNQLNQQIDDAASQAAEHEHLALRFGHRQDDDDRLLNTLTLVYLNYELFRRQLGEYLMLTDRLATCFTLTPMMTCLIIYSSGVSLGSSNPFVIFSLFPLLLLQVDLLLVASSYRLKQMEKIMNKAMRILAHCSSGPIQFSYPIELWRRQVCAFEESWWRYASRLFGIHITYQTVISLNIYAIALLLILLKPQRSPLF